MKRNLIILIMIAVISLVAGSIIYFVAGLGNSENIKLSGKITVVADSGNYQAVNHAAAVFKELHPRIEIEVIQESDVYADLSAEVKKGSLKEDVFVVPEKNVLPVLNSSEGYFMDLTQYVNGVGESFPKGVLAGLTYNKSIYGIPWTTKPMVVLYRKDLFSVNGVDVSEIKTWDDFRKVGIGLSGKTGKKFLVYNTDQFEQLRSTLLSQLRIKYSDQENYTRVTELINGMVAEETLQATSSEVSTLKQGKALAAIVSPSDAIAIMNEASALKGKWGAMELPAFEPGGNRDVTLGGYSLMINKNTHNGDLAKEFGKYLSSDGAVTASNLKQYGIFSAAYTVYGGDSFGFSSEYFGMDIWSLFADVAARAPQNVYQ